MSETVIVETGTVMDPDKAEIKYEKRDDGWYVDDGDGFDEFASVDAQKKDVEQLIRKEYDSRY